MSEPIKVFISYSHRDDELKQELVSHLKGLERQKIIKLWHDRDISAGTQWAQQIDQSLNEAHIILFLVSSDFIASDYCSSIEMERALERDRTGSARTIPVIIRACDWLSTPLQRLQGIPRDNKAVATWGDRFARDTAWLQIADSVKGIAQEIRDRIQAEEAATIKQAALAEYQKAAEECYADGVISPLEQRRLDIIAQNNGLVPSDIEPIMVACKADYDRQQEVLNHYRHDVKTAIENYGGLVEQAQLELAELRRLQNISGSVAQSIEEVVLAEWERQRETLQQDALREAELRQQQAQLEIDRQQKLERYRAELQRAIAAGYPFDQFVEKGLLDFQHSLGLMDGDVAMIRTEVLTPVGAAYQARLKKQEEDARQRAAAEKRQQEEAEKQRPVEVEKRQQEENARIERERREAEQAASKKKDTDIQLQSFSFPVVELDERGKERNRTTHQAQYFSEFLAEGVTLDMVAIPGGLFLMGSPEGEGSDREKPQHRVTVPAFYMGKFPVTQAQWRAVAGLPRVKQDLDKSPSRFKGDQLPVEKVSWHDAVEFCDRLSRKTGQDYRLPSEAEWEYACRAKTRTRYHFGHSISLEFANVYQEQVLGGLFQKKPVEQTSRVGHYQVANSFGLFDMHGNVWEWCLDIWHDSYKDAPENGSAWDDELNGRRVLRGGSWDIGPVGCRSASRIGRHPGVRAYNFGFRVVCLPQGSA